MGFVRIVYGIVVHTIQNPARAARKRVMDLHYSNGPFMLHSARLCGEACLTTQRLDVMNCRNRCRWMGLHRASNAAQYQAEWVLPSFFKSLPEGNGCRWNRNHTKLAGSSA